MARGRMASGAESPFSPGTQVCHDATPGSPEINGRYLQEIPSGAPAAATLSV